MSGKIRTYGDPSAVDISRNLHQACLNLTLNLHPPTLNIAGCCVIRFPHHPVIAALH